MEVDLDDPEIVEWLSENEMDDFITKARLIINLKSHPIDINENLESSDDESNNLKSNPIDINENLESSDPDLVQVYNPVLQKFQGPKPWLYINLQFIYYSSRPEKLKF